MLYQVSVVHHFTGAKVTIANLLTKKEAKALARAIEQFQCCDVFIERLNLPF